LTLGQICTDFRDLSAPVIQLLSTYLKQEKADYGETGAPADIGEIIRIIAREARQRLGNVVGVVEGVMIECNK
jgi:hypothetical protein